MKTKLIQLSIITSLALSLNASNTIEPITNWTKYPLPQEVVSKSKGGQLSDKEAMKDGIGAIVVKSINVNSQTLNNEEYNKLLLLNKDKLTNTVGLKELIANGDIIVDTSTLNSINGNGLSNPIGLPADGTSCNDNNPLTINDIYTNNVCVGTSIVGTSCDDSNAQTSDDKYDVNGICVGVMVVDGTPCDDGLDNSLGDSYLNGICTPKYTVNNPYYISVSGSNTNSGITKNLPLLDFTNIPINSNVILLNGVYNSMYGYDSYLGINSVFKGTTLRDGFKIFGETQTGVIINIFNISTRDQTVIGHSNNTSIINMTINHNLTSSTDYTVSLNRFSNNSSFENIIFNISGYYSLNYNNSQTSPTNYNNCVFNGGTKLSNYSGSQIIRATSIYPIW